MVVSSLFSGLAVFALKHALALAQASGGGKCRGGPLPSERSGAKRGSAQAKRGRLGCLFRAPEAESLRRLGFLALRGAHGDGFVVVLRGGVAGRNNRPAEILSRLSRL
jgi:hypothetical protein